MPLWLIPMLYTVASVTAGLTLPRLEHTYLANYTESVSVGSALAFFLSVSSGMMALTGIVFAIAFVLVQFNALAYSPRLVVIFDSSPKLFHTLGIFFATFFTLSQQLLGLIAAALGGSRCSPPCWSQCCSSSAWWRSPDWFRALTICRSTTCCRSSARVVDP